MTRDTPPTFKSNSFRFCDEWQNHLIERARQHYEDAEYPLPPDVRASRSYPTSGLRGSRLGECRKADESSARVVEIFVRPEIDDPYRVAMVTMFYLGHAAHAFKPRSKLKEVLIAVGFRGDSIRDMEPGSNLKGRLEQLAAECGPYPGKSLLAGGLRADAKPVVVGAAKSQAGKGRSLKYVCAGGTPDNKCELGPIRAAASSISLVSCAKHGAGTLILWPQGQIEDPRDKPAPEQRVQTPPPEPKDDSGSGAAETPATPLAEAAD